MATKFDELASEYKEVFETLDNGQRVGNPAVVVDEILKVRPTWGRNETLGAQCYAQERIYGFADHDKAMAYVNSQMIWR